GVGGLGGALGRGGGWDASYSSIEVRSGPVGGAVRSPGAASCRATRPADALERVRSERLMELLQQRDEPAAIAGKRFAGLLYGTGAYGNSVMGTAESVARIQLDDVRRFYNAHYLPNASALIISGDVDPARAADLAAKKFGDWKKASEPARPVVSPQSIAESRIYLIDRPQAVQSEIRIGHIGVSRSSEDYFAISVMNSILGGVLN